MIEFDQPCTTCIFSTVHYWVIKSSWSFFQAILCFYEPNVSRIPEAHDWTLLNETDISNQKELYQGPIQEKVCHSKRVFELRHGAYYGLMTKASLSNPSSNLIIVLFASHQNEMNIPESAHLPGLKAPSADLQASLKNLSDAGRQWILTQLNQLSLTQAPPHSET